MLYFQDSLIIESFEDPKVKGVTLYLSNFQVSAVLRRRVLNRPIGWCHVAIVDF